MTPARGVRALLPPYRCVLLLVGTIVLGLASFDVSGRAESNQLRVCADPNNLPFSDAQGHGFENKLAELVARELGKEVAYVWQAQRRGFIRKTLKAGACEVVMGVPPRLKGVETTRPYYRSTYVFVSRADRHLDLRSLEDDRLRGLKIGVHLIGDDGSNTPPADALGERGIVNNVVGYMIYGDYREADPPARLIEAVERGDVDVAAAWGPLAGFAARSSPVPLSITPIADSGRFRPLTFQFDIAMGVRKGDDQLRQALDSVIARKGADIRVLLETYGVPLVDSSQRSSTSD